MIGRVALLVTFKKAKPKSQSLSRSHIRDLGKTPNHKLMGHLFEEITTPLRQGLTMAEKWKSTDNGLIFCWEMGRRNAIKNPELAKYAKRGELIPLGWKGGVDKAILKGNKVGSLKYYAEWLGLRGENLDIDTSQDITLTCSATGMIVTFTADINKLKEA